MSDIEKIRNDKASIVDYNIYLNLRNMNLTPEQREAFHTAVINATRMLRMQLLFALPDQKLAKISLERRSSAAGKVLVPFFEED